VGALDAELVLPLGDVALGSLLAALVCPDISEFCPSDCEAPDCGEPAPVAQASKATATSSALACATLRQPDRLFILSPLIAKLS